jgi:putative colanic acid biosynthesis UDP-glucose lipid carrier transferase
MLPRGLLKEHSQVLTFVFRCLDAGVIAFVGWLLYVILFDQWQLTPPYLYALWASIISTLIVFQFFQIYKSVRAQYFGQQIIQLMQAVFGVLILLAGLAFMTKTGEIYSRSWFAWWGISSFFALLIFRGGLVLFLRMMRTRGWNERRVVVIGAGELGTHLVNTMQHALWTGFKIVAILDDEPENKPGTLFNIPVLKMPSNMHDYLSQQKDNIDEIWLALPLRAEDRVKEILHEMRHHPLTIRLILDIFGMDLLNHSITHLGGFPTVNLNTSPIVGMNRIFKEIEDKVLAFLILLIISPLFLMVALAIKFSSKGPVFFKQLRHGWDGRIIKIYKFRTMVVHQDQTVLAQATINDQRITRLGRFLRRTSLDELPQFINVLQGRMSVVGPRPHAISHNEYYKDSIKAYMQRHKVKPGITGWAQVNGLRGETDTLDKMRNRVEYDLHYIENWSLLLDLKIIFLTFFLGFVGKNVY